MCESHTTHHLCGHVKTKTIVQCAHIIDKLIASGLSVNRCHQVCKDGAGENVHVFPDICNKCKKTGVVGDFMNVPGVKYEVFKAWEAKRKEKNNTQSDKIDDSEKNNESDRIKDLETLEIIPIPEEGNSSTSEAGTTVVSSSPMAWGSRTTSKESPPDLSQLKTRVAALKTRIEQLLTKICAHKPPPSG